MPHTTHSLPRCRSLARYYILNPNIPISPLWKKKLRLLLLYRQNIYFCCPPLQYFSPPCARPPLANQPGSHTRARPTYYIYYLSQTDARAPRPSLLYSAAAASAVLYHLYQVHNIIIVIHHARALRLTLAAAATILPPPSSRPHLRKKLRPPTIIFYLYTLHSALYNIVRPLARACPSLASHLDLLSPPRYVVPAIKNTKVHNASSSRHSLCSQ